jgi:hypothetical protein
VRFDLPASAGALVPAFTPLRVEGSIRHPETGEAWEYAVMISIANDRGEEVTRQVVGVGAIRPGEQRRFTFAVEVFTAEEAGETEPGAATPGLSSMVSRRQT